MSVVFIVILSVYLQLSQIVGSNQDDFIKLVDVSDTALGGEVHGGSYLSVPGIAIFDCNNDGLEDIFYASQENEYHKLFINKGNFEFTEEAVERGIDGTLGSWTPIAFDFDNNGDIDLALSWVGSYDSKSLQFYYNIGNCQFEDRTSSILGSNTIPELWTGASLSATDFDHDGDLDLIVNSAGSLGRTAPHSISGFSTIYINTLNDNDDKSFTFEILPRFNPPIPDYLQFVCVSGWEDFDEDGWDDVVIGICGDPYGIGDATHLWRNNFAENMVPDFQDVTSLYGLDPKCNTDLAELSGRQFPMTVSYGHLDEDNHFDLFTTNAGTPFLYTMYRANWDDKNNQFMGYEAVDVEGFNYDQFSWGATFIDLDNDGKDDIITVGAFVAFGIPTNPGYVYRNKVKGVSRRSGNKYIFEETQTLGLTTSSTVVANGDFDNDGYIDIAVNTVCDSFPNCTTTVPLKLYRNNGGDLKRQNRYYLDIALRGNVECGTNYYGVGSIIIVKIPHFQYEKRGKIRVGADGGNTNSIYAHFGIVDKHRMNNYDHIYNTNYIPKAEICVNWMGKKPQIECFMKIELNQRIILTQGNGIKIDSDLGNSYSDYTSRSKKDKTSYNVASYAGDVDIKTDQDYNDKDTIYSVALDDKINYLIYSMFILICLMVIGVFCVSCFGVKIPTKNLKKKTEAIDISDNDENKQFI